MTNLNLSMCQHGAKHTTLNAWNPTFPELIESVATPTIGTKDGSYFLRCAGTNRNNHDTEETASILVLDGDSTISEDGEIVAGAPDSQSVHDVLTSLDVNHVLYSSFSNAEGLHKYRVLIPIEYDRDQLTPLTNYFHSKLHENGVMLFNVKENRTWAQPWYFPRVSAQNVRFFKTYNHQNGELLDAAILCNVEKLNAPESAEDGYKLKRNKTSKYVQGQINPIDLFNIYWKSPVDYLLTKGYKAEGNRLIPPNSTTGTAGIQVCENCGDGVERVYSHNGSDPLNDGYAHDVFDCFKIIEHEGDQLAALKDIGASFIIEGTPLEQYNRKAWGAFMNERPYASVNVESLGWGA